MERNEITKDWITAAGLRGVILKRNYDSEIARTMGRTSQYCGYVAVPIGHPYYGKHYHEQLDCITRDQIMHARVGNKSPLLLLTAQVGADDANSVRRSLDLLIDVHGGITYSSREERQNEYPVESEGLWWFGFDCGHSGDDYPDGGQHLEYVINECEKMAQQFKEAENG